jgi:Ni,Fe-hydrogenase III large subunit/Ni,Fe-hydrogenase III component G
MNRFTWLPELLAGLEHEHVLIRGSSPYLLTPAHLLHVEIEDWKRCFAEIARQQFRFSALWAEESPPGHFEQEGLFIVNGGYEKQGDYLVLRTEVPSSKPIISSQTPLYPVANRAERHLQDLFGLVFEGHPDQRRWTRHKAWQADQYPLRRNFPVQGLPNSSETDSKVTPADSDYPFLQAHGAGVYEIPVGPVHAGIIEPGHFRFQAVGETVLNLEEHLGYVHKGIEKIAEGRDAEGLARLAGRVSGDTTVSHAWAACMAMERAANLPVPPRALMLRAILAERERVANHLWDIAAICNDVAFTFAYYQYGRLREQWLRFNQNLFGHRLMMDCIVPGGVRVDLSEKQRIEHIDQAARLHTELHELEDILERHTGLEDRLATAGVLSIELANKLGCVGYVGRASGQPYDVRRDSPYPPYNQFSLEVPLYTAGDVDARMQVRLDEIHVSLHLLHQMLTRLPRGETSTPWQPPAEDAEGFRGEILSYVRFGTDGKISRYYPRDPSWLTWPALELLIRDNIVPDFPVCNKSINGSYSGQDL